MPHTKILPDDMVPVDAEIDRIFGEPVVLKPMTTVSGGYRASVADPSRLEVVGVGIFDQGRGANVQTGGGVNHTQATVDTSLSIRFEAVEQCKLRKGDRVYFPDRDEMHEVTFIYADPGGRPDVHLVRVLEEQ